VLLGTLRATGQADQRVQEAKVAAHITKRTDIGLSSGQVPEEPGLRGVHCGGGWHTRAAEGCICHHHFCLASTPWFHITVSGVRPNLSVLLVCISFMAKEIGRVFRLLQAVCVSSFQDYFTVDLYIY
jgi:hypothetical protein